MTTLDDVLAAVARLDRRVEVITNKVMENSNRLDVVERKAERSRASLHDGDERTGILMAAVTAQGARIEELLHAQNTERDANKAKTERYRAEREDKDRAQERYLKTLPVVLAVVSALAGIATAYVSTHQPAIKEAPHAVP